MKVFFTFFLLFFSILSGVNFSSNLHAQVATFRGLVLDHSTGEPLIGATVYLDGTSFGTTTNIDGEFTLHKISPGTYTAVFSYIGYERVKFEELIFSVGENKVLTVRLKPSSILVEEVMVTTQAKGQMAAINQQLASNTITNVVSSDKIRDVPDVNAAESIGRLPGVAINRSGGEGDKIVVRGLAPQFTIIEVDGVRLSGVDLDRSVGLGSVSSEILDGIELSKSLTADKDADAIGGIVNLRTRIAESGLQFTINANGGYNELEKSVSNYKMSASIGNRFFEDKVGVILSGGRERVNRSSDNFDAGYGRNTYNESDADLRTDWANVVENRTMRFRTHAGITIDYKTDNVSVAFRNSYSGREDDSEMRYNNFNFDAYEYNQTIAASNPVEHIFTHALNSKIKIVSTLLEVNLSYGRTTFDEYVDGYGFKDISVAEGGSINDQDRFWKQPSDLIDQYFSIASIDQALLWYNTRRNISRGDISKTAVINWEIPFNFGSNISGKLKIGGKYSGKDRENDTDVQQILYDGSGNGGIAIHYVESMFPDLITKSEAGIPGNAGIVAKNFEDPDYDYGKVLDGRYEQYLGWSADLDKLQNVHDEVFRNAKDLHYLMKGVESNQYDYISSERKAAAYIMAVINIGENIMILPGIRHESMETTYTGKYIEVDYFDFVDGMKWSEDVTAQRNNGNWFPSINTKFKFSSWGDIRAAYYKSAARPDFFLLSPSMISDANRTFTTAYNPFLIPSKAHNFDLGISAFTNKTGLLSFNVFYKELNDMVYRINPTFKMIFLDDDDIKSEIPQALVNSLEAPQALYDDRLIDEESRIDYMPVNNPYKAFFSGFEISSQNNFWYLPGLLSGFVLDLNYSMIWTNTKYPYFNEITTGFPTFTTIREFYAKEGQMLDSPNLLFNARLGWDYKGFSARISYRYQGATPSSRDEQYDIMNLTTGLQNMLDFTANQKVTDKLSVSLNLANITSLLEEQYYLSNGINSPEKDYKSTAYGNFYGFTGQFGLKYEFN